MLSVNVNLYCTFFANVNITYLLNPFQFFFNNKETQNIPKYYLAKLFTIFKNKVLYKIPEAFFVAPFLL